MRLFAITTLLGLGAVIAFVAGKRRSKSNELADTIAEPDPSDAVQWFDEVAPLHTEELAVDAHTTVDTEMEQDLATQESTLDERALEHDVPDSETIASMQPESGELYGVHTPWAVDHELLDDDQASAEGAHWLEALGASAAEHGACPEHELEIVEDSDFDSSTDSDDIPVADRGSAGPRGL